MPQSKSVLTVAICVAMLSIGQRVVAQTVVTPTLVPLPPGQMITVNNGPGDHFDPHVSDDLVAYSNLTPDGTQTVRYFNLATLVDLGVPGGPSVSDQLSDVRGSVIAFTRVDSSHAAIFTFDTANPGTGPIEIAAQAGSARQSAQIGDSSIAWQDFGFGNGTSSDIVAYDRASGTVTRLTSDGQMNQLPGVSPDGKIITWEDCKSFQACDIWSATGGGGNWTLHQLTNGNGVCTHPDSDGQIVVYSCKRSGLDNIYWQPAGGGPEQVLSFPRSSITPDVSEGFISFGNEGVGATNHNILFFDTSTTNLFEVTGGLADNVLSDISITSDGKGRVVWESGGANIFAYTFSLPVDESGISTLIGQLLSAGCIDNAGIANALTSKLAAAQAAGTPQTAINTLTAL